MKIKTSESVFRGHPDKVCDQISDAIVDACLEQDKESRVAIECFIKDNFLVVGGELTTKANIEITKIARDVLNDIGYFESFQILELISKQSPDIALGVDKDGAGDQGIMFGYASDETKSLMPLSLELSRNISIEMDRITKNIHSSIFGPDGKCQVSVAYEDEVPVYVTTVVVSAQTKPGVAREVFEPIINKVIDTAIPEQYLTEKTKILINPTGEFVVGGPYADSGLTGRKIICDTYGGIGRHGGGAFSGKDPSKVDRSAAYYCRYVAKHIVAAGLANKCEVGVSYAIGITRPISLTVDTFGTAIISEKALLKLVKEAFNFSPRSIRNELNLDSVNYFELAKYGHVGRDDLDLPWERLTNLSRVLHLGAKLLDVK